MGLSNREQRTLIAFAEVVVPTGGQIPQAAKDVSIVEFAQRYSQDIPKQTQLFIHLCLWLLEYCSWTLIFFPCFFSKADSKKREKIIQKVRNSRYFFIRGVYTFVSFLVLVPYYSDKSVLQNIKYEL